MHALCKTFLKFAALTSILFAWSASGFSQTTRYLFTNNDDSQGNSSTVYTLSASGNLTKPILINTSGFGWDGLGSVATNKINVTHDANGDCAFLSEYVSVNGTAHPDVAAISVSTLTGVGNFQGSASDQVQNSGMGLATNKNYVYSNFTGSQTIGTYKRLPSCQLQFVQDISAKGLSGSSIVAMKATQNILVVTYGDGSIESFDIAGGVPVANGDLQYSTGHATGDAPQGVDVTADGHYALFGDSSNRNTPTIEVSDLSSGKLAPTVVYTPNGASSSAGLVVWLSPDESLLYMSDFSSGQVSAAVFDKATGVISSGCTSAVLNGQGRLWSFVAGLATASRSGTGGVLYVAEPDTRIGVVRVTGSGSGCGFSESASSPVLDSRTITLESIGVFPPRAF
jgi:hypothetical protein